MKYLLALLATCLCSHAANITVAWDASPDVVSGYKVYWGPTQATVKANSVTLTNTLTATVTVAAGINFFAAAAWIPGAESDLSNIISTNVPPGAPVQFRFTQSTTNGTVSFETNLYRDPVVLYGSYDLEDWRPLAMFTLREHESITSLKFEVTTEPKIGFFAWR